MKVGFIGTGNMGSILIEAFIRSGALEPSRIVASNRTPGKAERLAKLYPGLEVTHTNIEVALESDILFLCVKPSEYKKVIDDIAGIVLESQIVVSVTSAVLLRHLNDRLPCKIAKIIPSITNYVMSGATLCMYGERMEAEDIAKIEKLLGHISRPLVIEESHTRICSDLSSCGPAFVAFFLQKFIEAAVEQSGISSEVATELASEMLLGTGKLLTEGDLDPVTLQKRVSVPGGITAEGLRLMEGEMEGLFVRLVRITHAKYEEDLVKVDSILRS